MQIGGGRASPRAARTCPSLKVYFHLRSQQVLGFTNSGSRGRDPSRVWVRAVSEVMVSDVGPGEVANQGARLGGVEAERNHGRQMGAEPCDRFEVTLEPRPTRLRFQHLELGAFFGAKRFGGKWQRDFISPHFAKRNLDDLSQGKPIQNVGDGIANVRHEHP